MIFKYIDGQLFCCVYGLGVPVTVCPLSIFCPVIFSEDTHLLTTAQRELSNFFPFFRELGIKPLQLYFPSHLID